MADYGIFSYVFLFLIIFLGGEGKWFSGSELVGVELMDVC